MPESVEPGTRERGTPAPKAKVVVVFNQKGGIGKTTTSVNLAVCLAAMGRRVILVDLDAQGNASTSVGLGSPAATGAYQLLRGEVDLADASRPTPYPNLRLVAGSDDLSWADVEIAVRPEPQHVLERALVVTRDEADVVVIDCPPAFGILSVNATVAADVLLLPVVPSPLALDGLHKAWWNIQRVRTHFNRDLTSMGILFTMTEDSELMHRLEDAIQAAFGARVLPVMIPRDLAAIEAAARDIPLAVLDPSTPASAAYRQLAETVALRFLDQAGDPLVPSAETVAERLAQWRTPGPHHHGLEELPPVHEAPPVQAGRAPDPGWQRRLDEAEDEILAQAIPAGLGWKVGVGVLLMVLGGILGFVFGRWYYLGW